MIAAVDTVAVIARIQPDHQFHGQAVAALAHWPFLVMNTVNLAEVLAGADRHVWDEITTTLIDGGFAFDATSAEQMAAARVDTRLKMPDACVIAVARARGADAVITFDARLRAAALAAGFSVNEV